MLPFLGSAQTVLFALFFQPSSVAFDLTQYPTFLVWRDATWRAKVDRILDRLLVPPILQVSPFPPKRNGQCTDASRPPPSSQAANKHSQDLSLSSFLYSFPFPIRRPIPRLQVLVYSRGEQDVMRWVDEMCRWPFRRIIPAHFVAPIEAGPADLRRAFAYIQRARTRAQ